MRKFEGMKQLLIVAGMIGGMFVMNSCKDDPPEQQCPPPVEPTVKLTVHPKFGALDLYLDSSYTTAEGYGVKFTDIKFYVQDVRNGSTSMIDAGLFDYRERGTLLLETTGEPTDFGSLQANLGVEASINHDDPAGFANSSMLNIANANDMHWGWNPGYIFVKVEAKADTIIDATELFDHNVVFHCGLDANMQTLDFTNLQWQTIGENQSELQFELNMATFLQGSVQSIDLKTEHSSHSMAGQEFLVHECTFGNRHTILIGF